MHLTRRMFVTVGGAAAFQIAAAESAPLPSADRVHAELVSGNRRFVSGHARHPHSSLGWAKRQGREGQHPHAVILCCSDSRVSPEIIFDQGLGDLFVVRVVGNVVQDDEIGSIDYAVEHLKVPLCLVLGHTGCGAVTAAVEDQHVPNELEHLIAPVRSTVAKVKTLHPKLTKAELIQESVRLHVREACAVLSRTQPTHLRVEGAVYHLQDGRVEWMNG